MLGARLARRILFPLLALLAVLFVLLGFAAVGIAQKRVDEELNDAADRVAATLAALPMAPEHRGEILPAVAGLMGCQIVLGDYATDSSWTPADLARIQGGRVTLQGRAYTTLVRDLPAPWGSCATLFSRERIARRRKDVLVPIALAGALGLLAAFAISLLAARRIALPVRALAQSAARFAQGRFAGDVGPRGPGEVGDLQDAFVAMARQLREG